MPLSGGPWSILAEFDETPRFVDFAGVTVVGTDTSIVSVDNDGMLDELESEGAVESFADGLQLYWIRREEFTVWHLDLSDADAKKQQLHQIRATLVIGLTGGADYLSWVEYPSNGPAGAGIKTLPRRGGEPTEVAEDVGLVSQLGSSGGRIFWVTAEGSAFSAAAVGGDIVQLVPGGVVSATAGGSTLYFSRSDRAADTATIEAVPLAGGDPSTLLDVSSRLGVGPQLWAIHEGNLYWTGMNINRTPVSD